mmetsp:Transcript_59281/g.105374  ORF Transcript_59281/g.105374 Transcript_59281/m.105374 type:complete len:285 (-) Transcript_59281:301-1155(-)|eukprot:CAMPEP_0197629080 /NCGR_PEP_ID=MMETSP1338-20131121/7090_1 /TAXON_ID=43686 ORGANISM="Pelagodinium beii, Strain RCC1491" /NCGR_SAMPLE_ID=MMETSP1338 /ASSEMBLY_ACC=CAM_ASM_000754 /LENGTH=284 /DNA_ID=CAMNT_0043200087 /DNA_START=76 /DNA_END=930 /DNA_ORIENTATION=+
MACLEWNNVLAAIIAFAMSLGAFMLALNSRQNVDSALKSMGDGAGMDGYAHNTVIHVTISMLISAFACLCICLSTFDCVEGSEGGFVHKVTGSTAFCVMRIITFFAFLVELAFSSAMLLAVGVVFFLDFLCRMGSTTLFHAQEVIWEIGNFTLTGTDPFDPYRTGNFTDAKLADTPVFSIAKLTQSLNLAEFCPNAKYLGNYVLLFWLACVLGVVSQALMAIALNGEKERVSVHEQHEAVGLGDVGGKFSRDYNEGAGLLGSAGSALSGLDQSFNRYRAGGAGH